MRVLQVFNFDSGRGGGQIVLDRLHQRLRMRGIDSRILCGSKVSGSAYSVAIPRSPRLENSLRRITQRIGLNDIHCVSSFSVKRMEEYEKCDILHIHGIHGNYFSYLALPAITQNKATVYTLHDMWALTGHCAYSYDCDRWKTGCGRCPYPNHYPNIRRDNTRMEWKLKKWAYGRSSLTIIAVSKWLAEMARQSMLGCFPVYHIPNGVDTEAYYPLDTAWCRSVLGIPAGKKVIMFMAMYLDKSHSESYRKGADLLLNALNGLPDTLKDDSVLLLLGEKGEWIESASGIKTVNLGYIGSDRLKAICYSAADVFVHPTRAEAFGLTIIESMACGTPVVSFRVGGVTELVRPGLTGYLAEPEDAKDICKGIVQLLEDQCLRNAISQCSREIALKEYSLGLHVQRHVDLYYRVLRERES